jgi:hypothetical protein
MSGRPNNSGSRWYQTVKETANGQLYFDHYSLTIESGNLPPREQLDQLIRDHHDDEQTPIIRGQSYFNRMPTESKFDMLDFMFARLASSFRLRLHDQLPSNIDRFLGSIRVDLLSLYHDVFDTVRRPNANMADEVEPPLSDEEKAARLENFLEKGYPIANLQLSPINIVEPVRGLEEIESRAAIERERAYSTVCRCCPQPRRKVELYNLRQGLFDAEEDEMDIQPSYSPCNTPPHKVFGSPYSEMELDHLFGFDSTLGGREEVQHGINSAQRYGQSNSSSSSSSSDAIDLPMTTTTRPPGSRQEDEATTSSLSSSTSSSSSSSSSFTRY